jgi:signal transduction histidine kinase
VQWEMLPLVLAGVLSLALLLLGFRVADQQRRALKEAASRVSFVNQVSHELGTPLTNLRLNLELASDLLPEGAEAARGRLGIVLEESLRLSWLVANVLQQARHEKGSLVLHPTLGQAAETILSAVERFYPSLQRKGFTVETQLPELLPPVRIDHAALAQIVTNLLSNVEKYASCGQWVRISLAQSTDQLMLQIADHGPGIRAADAERIFQPFTRLQSSLTEGSSGTGLGLAIVQELAHRMDGRATLVNPDSTTGATFQVAIKLTPSDK